MKKIIIRKCQKGNYIAPLDNTRVQIKMPILPVKLNQQLIQELKRRKLLLYANKSKSYIYDTKKAEFYKNLLNFYNLNAFGYGILGKLTNIDYNTPEGLKAILSNFDYAKGNAKSFMENIVGAGIASGTSMIGNKAAQVYSKVTKGAFKTPSKNGALGTLKLYTTNPIGSGSEAVVIKNTPTTVGKITSIPSKEMAARNSIPNTVQSKYIGYVKDSGTKLPTYVLKKVKVLTDKTFPKYVDKLDKAMQKSGFRLVKDPNVLYRAYTNGKVVVDDVSPGNVGLDWLRRPKMIDFNLQTVPLWLAQGFTLKNGGKLPPKHLYKNHTNQSNNIDTILNSYPEVSLDEEPWAREYFLNNPNVAGMAIGSGLNGVSGKRRVIVNPYNEFMKDPILRKGLLTNERLRHYMDETNFRLPNITLEQLNKYKETPYENDTLNIGRTEAARYLVNDKSNSLTNEQIKYINSYFSKKSNQKYRLGGIMKNKLLKYLSGGYTVLPDNTRVNSPMLVTPIKRKLKPGLVRVHGAIITPKKETVRKDTRTLILRNNNQKEALSAYKLYLKLKITELGIKNIEGFIKMFSPSTYIGPMFRDNNKSYVENVMSGEGSGNNIGNIAIDVITPIGFRFGNRLRPSRVRMAFYNNVMPGSYFLSYKGSKGNEIKSAIKDILIGDTKTENPKWVKAMETKDMYSLFKWDDDPKLATAIRSEAWKKSLGIPHKDKYLLSTGKFDNDGHPIVTYNLNEIPISHLKNFVNAVTDQNQVIPDYIGNTGGWVLASKEGDDYILRDLWDILPFKDPNRERVLPKSLKDLLAYKVNNPPGSAYDFSWKWKSWVPKSFIDFDPTRVIGKGPFMNITKINSKISK